MGNTEGRVTEGAASEARGGILVSSNHKGILFAKAEEEVGGDLEVCVMEGKELRGF